jgi:2-keto-3-deoxy-6-phosphogluconate aldolase
MANRASVRTPQVIRFVIDSVANVAGPTYTVLQDCEIVDVIVVSTVAQACQLTLRTAANVISVVNTAAPNDGSIGEWTSVDTTAARVYVAAGTALEARTGAANSRCEVWVTVLPGLNATL